MAMAKTKTKVVNLTRVDMVQGTAKRFLDIASEAGANCDFYYERLEVMTRMHLVNHFELVAFSGKEAIGGVGLYFDWETHTALVQAKGEFIDPKVLNQYGTADSITDTLELVRNYVLGLMEHYPEPSVSVWYSFNEQRVRELGQDRFQQILGYAPRSAEQERETEALWAKIAAEKADKSKRRTSTIGDLPETSIKAW